MYVQVSPYRSLKSLIENRSQTVLSTSNGRESDSEFSDEDIDIQTEDPTEPYRRTTLGGLPAALEDALPSEGLASNMQWQPASQSLDTAIPTPYMPQTSTSAAISIFHPAAQTSGSNASILQAKPSNSFDTTATTATSDPSQSRLNPQSQSQSQQTVLQELSNSEVMNEEMRDDSELQPRCDPFLPNDHQNVPSGFNQSRSSQYLPAQISLSNEHTSQSESSFVLSKPHLLELAERLTQVIQTVVKNLETHNDQSLVELHQALKEVHSSQMGIVTTAVTNVSNMLQNDISNMHTKVENIDTVLTSTSTSVASFGITIQNLDSKISLVASALDATRTGIEDQITKLDEDFTKDSASADTKVANFGKDMTEKFATLQTAIDSIGTVQNKIFGELTAINDRISKIEDPPKVTDIVSEMTKMLQSMNLVPSQQSAPEADISVDICTLTEDKTRIVIKSFDFILKLKLSDMSSMPDLMHQIESKVSAKGNEAAPPSKLSGRMGLQSIETSSAQRLRETLDNLADWKNWLSHTVSLTNANRFEVRFEFLAPKKNVRKSKDDAKDDSGAPKKRKLEDDTVAEDQSSITLRYTNF